MKPGPVPPSLASSVTLAAAASLPAPDWALAMPSPGPAAAFSVSRHTEQSDGEPSLSHLSLPTPLESPNDVFAAVFGTKPGRAGEDDLESLVDLLSTIKRMASVPSTLGSRLDREGDPQVEMLLGPITEAEDGTRATWIEARNPATGEWACPEITWLIDKLPPLVAQDRDVPPCERFQSGPVRLLVELGVQGSSDLSIMPWVSAECRDEALLNFIRSVRSGGAFGPSYLHSAVLSALCMELSLDEIIPETTSLSSLYEELGMTVCAITQASNGEVSVGLAFTEEGALSAGLKAVGLNGFTARFGIGERGDFAALDIRLWQPADAR